MIFYILREVGTIVRSLKCCPTEGELHDILAEVCETLIFFIRGKFQMRVIRNMPNLPFSMMLRFYAYLL